MLYEAFPMAFLTEQVSPLDIPRCWLIWCRLVV